jgi:DNA repair protein RadC
MHLQILDSATLSKPGAVVPSERERALLDSLTTLVGKRYARELVGRLGANGLEHFDAEQIATSGGIPARIASQIIAARDLARTLREHGLPKVPDPNALLSALPPEFPYLEREVLLGIALSASHEVKATVVLSVGGLAGACVTVRDVFVPLIRHSAAAFAIAHNHPSGDKLPSREDVYLTNALSHAGVLLGIPLLDHLVVARNGFTSLRDSGLLLSDDELEQLPILREMRAAAGEPGREA